VDRIGYIGAAYCIMLFLLLKAALCIAELMNHVICSITALTGIKKDVLLQQS